MEFAQHFMEALKSINSKPGPPAPPHPSGDAGETKSEEPKARASTLKFKKVNEV